MCNIYKIFIYGHKIIRKLSILSMPCRHYAYFCIVHSLFTRFLSLGATFSNHNSTIYIYTDAPAKDESRETEVIEILQRKSITPKFRLRPECGTRRKRDTGMSSLYFKSSNIF